VPKPLNHPGAVKDMNRVNGAFQALIVSLPFGGFICTVLVHSYGWSLQAGIIAGLSLMATLSIVWAFRDYVQGHM